MVVTIELRPDDAWRLLHLVQGAASNGPIYNEYWESMAVSLRDQIEEEVHGEEEKEGQ